MDKHKMNQLRARRGYGCIMNVIWCGGSSALSWCYRSGRGDDYDDFSSSGEEPHSAHLWRRVLLSRSAPHKIVVCTGCLCMYVFVAAAHTDKKRNTSGQRRAFPQFHPVARAVCINVTNEVHD